MKVYPYIVHSHPKCLPLKISVIGMGRPIHPMSMSPYIYLRDNFQRYQSLVWGGQSILCRCRPIPIYGTKGPPKFTPHNTAEIPMRHAHIVQMYVKSTNKPAETKSPKGKHVTRMHPTSQTRAPSLYGCSKRPHPPPIRQPPLRHLHVHAHAHVRVLSCPCFSLPLPCLCPSPSPSDLPRHPCLPPFLHLARVFSTHAD
jgi:hypothetical protein